MSRLFPKRSKSWTTVFYSSRTVPGPILATEEMGKKHLIGSRRDCLVPAPTLEEMREARRQNRNTRPALTKHTPIVHQRSNGGAGTKKNVKRKIG